MMTLEMVMELLATAEDDLSVDVDSHGDVDVTVEDFEGFDEDWSEIERDYDEELVDSIEKRLEASSSYSILQKLQHLIEEQTSECLDYGEIFDAFVYGDASSDNVRII